MSIGSVFRIGLIVLGRGVLLAQARPEPPVAEAYGPSEQALHVGAASLEPVGLTLHYISGSEGYLYLNEILPPGGGLPLQREFVAPITLPAGAEVFRTCLYAYDAEPGYVASVRLEAVRIATASQPIGIVPIVESYAETTLDLGYQVSCTEPYSYTYRDTGDVDGDGASEHLVHRIRVVLLTLDTIAFGGVRLLWRRQVSPAPVAATFADIPTKHAFFPFVEALAASGITAGCGGGNFCPDSPLTRGQMAVFLAKALGLHWPY